MMIEPTVAPVRDNICTEDRLHSMAEGARRLGISLPKFKLMARSAQIETVRLGRRRLVAESTLQSFIADLLKHEMV